VRATPILTVIQVTDRSSRAYAAAAEGFRSDPLAVSLREIADRRLQFAAVLRAATQPGSPPANTPAPRLHGHRHRDWYTAHEFSAVQRTLLVNLVRSEDSVLFRYSLALAHDLPHSVLHILAEQFAEVGDNQDRIRALPFPVNPDETA